ALFALGMLAAIALLLAPLAEELVAELLHEYDGASHLVEELIVVLAGLAPITAGLREGYADKQALSEEAKQYQQMGVLFSRASALWRDALSAGRLAEVPRLACALGEEALAENGDWVMLQRARPMQVPK